jgi:2-oxoglutarate ferredoxin oxidoreductase subunit gamma
LFLNDKGLVKIMSTVKMIFAGFGGQGILFAGRVASYAGFLAGKEITWLPAYGAEARGGTSNSAVIISDDLIGSPIVRNPDYLTAMNLPSLDRFESLVKPGGTIFVDETIIPRKVSRDDVTSVYIPATFLADQNGFPKLANVVMLGGMMKETGMFTPEEMYLAIEKSVSDAKVELTELNYKAFDIGYSYKDSVK